MIYNFHKLYIVVEDRVYIIPDKPYTFNPSPGTLPEVCDTNLNV